MNDRSPDIRLPKAMFSKLGLPFHVHEAPKVVDPEFKEIFLTIHFSPQNEYCPQSLIITDTTVTNSISSVSEKSGGLVMGKQPAVVSGYKMAYPLGYWDSSYAIRACEELLPEMLTAAGRSGVNMMTLLYWENTMGNWGTVGNSESDIAVEEFDPYDSHFLYETFLAVDDKYRTYSNNRLFREMIKRMWPELLQWPINPPADNLRDRVVFSLKKIGVYPLLKQLKYQVRYARRSYARVGTVTTLRCQHRKAFTISPNF